MLSIFRPRRFLLCGVPVTYELALRLVLLCITVGLLTIASIPKVRSILDQVNVVSVSMVNTSRIPPPNTIVCGSRLETVDVEMYDTGIAHPNGTFGPPTVKPVPPEMVEIRNATELDLRAQVDWPKEGKCVLFRPQGLYFARHSEENPQAMSRIIFVVQANETFTGNDPRGLSIAFWNDDEIFQEKEPMWTNIPSINTLTFVYTEYIKLNKKDKPETQYTLQKQNLLPSFKFSNRVIGRFIISPDNFVVTRYIDKASYTWVDLAGAVGGMASIALAVWIFLFGSGKYKSWGVMQRYILRTSPNSRHHYKRDEMPKSTYETAKDFFKKQLSKMDSSAGAELDSMPLHGSTMQNPRRLSQRYSTIMNMNTAANAAVAVGSYGNGSGRGNGGTAYTAVNNATHLGIGDDLDPGMRRYSMESSGPTNYYFTEHGAPRTQSLQPLAPINEDEDETEAQVSELIRLIDLRIDERMWSLERTLARYYLDGFRLRDYSVPQYHLQLNEGQVPGGNGELAPKYEQGRTDSEMEVLHSSSCSDDRSNQGLYSPSSSPSSSPPIPPRPSMAHNYQRFGQTSLPTAVSDAGAQPRITTVAPSKEEVIAIENTSPSSHPSQNGRRNLGESELPLRKDMRGTIRKAVERLQNEWPQSRAAMPVPEPYVPRTQYQSKSASNNNSSNSN